MPKDHKFEELEAPAQAAKALGLSVATLRKYSVMIERVTQKRDYYQRSRQNARLYRQSDLTDLGHVQELIHHQNLSLAQAVQQVFGVIDPGEKKPAITAKPVDDSQVAQLLKLLEQTIASQNQAIAALQAQVARVEKQNQELLKVTKALPSPQAKSTKESALADKIAAMPDISGIVSVNPAGTRAKKTQAEIAAEVAADRAKTSEQVHQEILQKSREKAEAATYHPHRTLADMQLPTKEHWWQRLFKW